MKKRLDIKNKIVKPLKGRASGTTTIFLEDKSNLIPRSSLREIVEQVPLLINNHEVINKRFKRDLFLLGIIDGESKLTDFAKSLATEKPTEQVRQLKEKCMRLPKMRTIKEFIDKPKRVTAKDLLKLLPLNFFGGEMESSKILYAAKAMIWLKK